MPENSVNKAPTLQIPKEIVMASKLLETISSKLLILIAAKLFTTTIKYKIYKRELHMGNESAK